MLDEIKGRAQAAPKWAHLTAEERRLVTGLLASGEKEGTKMLLVERLEEARESYEAMRHDWYTKREELIEAQGKLEATGRLFEGWQPETLVPVGDVKADIAHILRGEK